MATIFSARTTQLYLICCCGFQQANGVKFRLYLRASTT